MVKTHAFNEHSPGAHGPEVPIMQSCQRPVAAHGCHNGHPEQPCAVTGRWPSSARPHNHTPVHNDRPSTIPIPRRCLLTPRGPGPVVSLHVRARTLPTRMRTRHAPLAHTTGTHLASSDSTCEPARFPACALARALAQPLAQHGHLHAPPTTSPLAHSPSLPPPPSSLLPSLSKCCIIHLGHH